MIKGYGKWFLAGANAMTKDLTHTQIVLLGCLIPFAFIICCCILLCCFMCCDKKKKKVEENATPTPREEIIVKVDGTPDDDYNNKDDVNVVFSPKKQEMVKTKVSNILFGDGIGIAEGNS